jgi:Zn finger protein HypA/HybF involved in hydrogenase expression
MIKNKRKMKTTKFDLSRQCREDKFISEALARNNTLYSYHLVVGTFKNVDIPVEILCNRCNKTFFQSPYNHIKLGAGCKSCNLHKTKVIPLQIFIDISKEKFGDQFNYSKVIYKNCDTTIILICNYCNYEFIIKPYGHLRGNGCQRCNGIIKNLEDFKTKSSKIHNDSYNYDYVIFGNNKTKVTIFCKKCKHYFTQSINNHLSGYGCKRCNRGKQENNWLDSLGIFIENRQKRLPFLKALQVDGYDPKTNTVYEFYGDFWHGNPYKYKPDDINVINHKTFGELYQNTIFREKEIRKYYNLVTIWESDLKRKSIVASTSASITE